MGHTFGSCHQPVQIAGWKQKSPVGLPENFDYQNVKIYEMDLADATVKIVALHEEPPSASGQLGSCQRLIGSQEFRSFPVRSLPRA